VKPAVAALLACVAAVSACKPAKDEGGMTRVERRIDEALAPDTRTETRDGLAAAIVIDVSGSMDDSVTGDGGRSERKIEIARRAARDLVEQFARYAEDHKDEQVMLGIYEFSERSGQPDCRPIVPMGSPDRDRAAGAIATMKASGGTPIGNAMITAKRALDATGLARRHLLVVTDGDNTDGFDPDDVTAVINRRPEVERPSIYFVAFDIEASKFSGVKDNGGLVLAAANARELNDTLDSLLRGKILLEK